MDGPLNVNLNVKPMHTIYIQYGSNYLKIKDIGFTVTYGASCQYRDVWFMVNINRAKPVCFHKRILHLPDSLADIPYTNYRIYEVLRRIYFMVSALNNHPPDIGNCLENRGYLFMEDDNFMDTKQILKEVLAMKRLNRNVYLLMSAAQSDSLWMRIDGGSLQNVYTSRTLTTHPNNTLPTMKGGVHGEDT